MIFRFLTSKTARFLLGAAAIFVAGYTFTTGMPQYYAASLWQYAFGEESFVRVEAAVTLDGKELLVQLPVRCSTVVEKPLSLSHRWNTVNIPISRGSYEYRLVPAPIFRRQASSLKHISVLEDRRVLQIGLIVDSRPCTAIREGRSDVDVLFFAHLFDNVDEVKQIGSHGFTCGGASHGPLSCRQINMQKISRSDYVKIVNDAKATGQKFPKTSTWTMDNVAFFARDVRVIEDGSSVKVHQLLQRSGRCEIGPQTKILPPSQIYYRGKDLCAFETAKGMAMPTLDSAWIKLKDGKTRVQFRLRAIFPGFGNLWAKVNRL
ncbi:MAG: hypothetical protein JXQ99_14400 [Hyphomicrobiaceae bacterium]